MRVEAVKKKKKIAYKLSITLLKTLFYQINVAVETWELKAWQRTKRISQIFWSEPRMCIYLDIIRFSFYNKATVDLDLPQSVRF